MVPIDYCIDYILQMHLLTIQNECSLSLFDMTSSFIFIHFEFRYLLLISAYKDIGQNVTLECDVRSHFEQHPEEFSNYQDHRSIDTHGFSFFSKESGSGIHIDITIFNQIIQNAAWTILKYLINQTSKSFTAESVINLKQQGPSADYSLL